MALLCRERCIYGKEIRVKEIRVKEIRVRK
jgi:hypothetical protein